MKNLTEKQAKELVDKITTANEKFEINDRATAIVAEAGSLKQVNVVKESFTRYELEQLMEFSKGRLSTVDTEKGKVRFTIY